MTWTPPGPCDPRALADQERHGRSADERYDRELERLDRDAERAPLPAGHTALIPAPKPAAQAEFAAPPFVPSHERP